MKRINLYFLLLMSVFFIGTSVSCRANVPEGNVVIVENAESFYELIKGDTPVLVDFHATWCRPCRIQGPIIEALAAEMAGDVLVVKIDVDKFPRISSKYQVSGIPSIILFDSGKEVWKKVGLQQKETLKAAIAKYLKQKNA